MKFTEIIEKYREEAFSERGKGDQFERLMAAYLRTDPKYASLFKDLWLWNDFPAREALGGSDSGIDIVGLTNDGDYWAIQCKCYKAGTTIDKKSVDGFIATSSRTFPNEAGEKVRFNHRLWIDTTGSSWGRNAEQAIKDQDPKTSGLGTLTSTYNYYPNSNLISSVEAVDGTITSYEYDGLMRLKKITDPVGATDEWTYAISKNVQQHKSYILNTKTFPVDTNGLSSLTKLETFAYLDGLGRTQQTVGKAQTFSGKDQITSVRYDNQGRVDKSYQPFASNLSTGVFSTSYLSQPSTTTTYEPSPLNRPLTVLPPDFGAVGYTYGLNTLAITAANGTNYPIGTVYQKTAIDANNNKSRTFTDPQGRTIMTRRMDSGESTASFVDSKYDYDWRNLLIEVVPPDSDIDDDELNFIYEYDTKGLTSFKKIPSKDTIRYVYDARDLVIGYQDGFMQTQSQPWYIYKYDPEGRQIASGFHGSQPSNSTTTPSYILNTTTWGTSDEGKGKVEGQTTRLMGTSDFISSNPNYDDYGRVEWVKSNNPFKLTSNDDITSYFYDGANNAVRTTENVRLGPDQEDERTTTFSETIDNDGRSIAAFIQLSGHVQRQLSAKTYNDKDLVLINYQGGDATSYLQKVDYDYWTNQSLKTVNAAVANNTDLFGYRLNYHMTTGMGGLATVTQANGNINSIAWAESGQANSYHSYRYDYLNRLTFDYTQGDQYNTSYLYDKRGNFTNVTRNQNAVIIDNLTYDYKDDNENQLEDITDSADKSKGYKKANDDVYVYDNNGNLTRDPQKDIDVIYNHLDLPEEITFEDGRKINFLYDASGATWKKVLKNPDGSILQEHTYIGSYETINDNLYSIMHSEGRMVNKGLEDFLNYLYLDHQQRLDGVFEAQSIESTGNIIDESTSYEGSTEIILGEGFEVTSDGVFDATIVQAPTYTESWRYNWSIRDHLGNLRMEYTGASRTTLEVLQTQSYYPYGAHINKNLNTNLENKYAYNGIDHVGEFGLDWEMASYRSLDAVMGGRWLSVDPKAEAVYSYSPYSNVGLNPISNVDPEGDIFYAMPSISFSGGFSLGLEVGVGVPGVASAGVGGSFNFSQGSGSAYVQGTFKGAYAGIGTGGTYAGVGFNSGAFHVGASVSSSGGPSLSAGLGGGIASGSSGIGISYSQSDGLDYAANLSYTHQFHLSKFDKGYLSSLNSNHSSLNSYADIILLLDKEGAYGFGHTAMLIGDDTNGWTYISKDGRVNGSHLTGGDSRFEPLSFNTLADFNSQGRFSAYDRAKRLVTTTAQDKLAIDAATRDAKSRFHASSSNCKHTCQAGLQAAGFSTGSGVYPKNWFNSYFFKN